MIQIIPAILALTEEEYYSRLRKISQSGLFKEGWIQIDLTDNKFVPNQTIGLEVVAKYQTELKKEAHLMVEDPINWLEKAQAVGIERVIVHAETKNVHAALDKAWELGLMTGLALNPETAVDTVEGFVDRLDVIQIMSIHPGFSGQEFLPESLERVRKASHLKAENGKLSISVDGGVSTENARALVLSGADHLVLASHLLNGDIEANLEHLWEAVNSVE